MFRKAIISVVLLVAVLGLTGCFSSNPEDIAAFAKPYQVNVTADKYVLQPPDEVTVFCSVMPELNEQVQVIRADGKVSLEGVGEFEAAGKTPAQLSEMIAIKARSLRNLQGEHPVDVRVTISRSRVYYVLGQVIEPGPKRSSGRDSVLTAVATAKPNPMAWTERTQVVRPSSIEVLRKIFELNYNKMIAHGQASKDVLLDEGDIVFIPPTIIGGIALKMEEFLAPIGRAFSTLYMGRQAAGDNGGY